MRIFVFTACLLACLPLVDVSAAQPNIIFMLSDDQAWNGLSVAMHPQLPTSRSTTIDTPRLSQLAAEGMRFSAAYAPAPVCSPTRISLQTGKSPAQLHWTKAAPPEADRQLIEPRGTRSIADAELTIGELLQTAGYATAHFGKWHIGGGGPGKHGYDAHDGDTGNEHAFGFTDPNPVDIFGMADRTAAFMAASQKAGKPFFIQLSWNALHASQNALAATLAKYRQRLAGENEKRISVAAISEDLDTGVGRVLDAVDSLGLRESTYVVFMSDNGGNGGKRGPLRGGKGGLWEGGIRVPLIIRGPEITAGSWCHHPVIGYDLLPTFCEWAGLPSRRLPAGIEGGSLANTISSSGTATILRPREELYFHFPHYQSAEGPQSAIVANGMKLIGFYENPHVELYDLRQDLAESNNLADSRPQQAAGLKQKLEAYLVAIKADMPQPNPDYDPALPASSQPKKGGKRGSSKTMLKGSKKPKKTKSSAG